MNNQIFQTIFNMLQEFLPSTWDEVVFYAAYTEGSYSIKYYVKNGTEVTNCFNLPGLNKAQLVKLFMAINKELAAARAALSAKDTWSVMTMIISADGNMKTYFDYDDISENSIAYAKAWEEKYL